MDEKYSFESIGIKIEGTEERLRELVGFIKYDETPSGALRDLVSQIEMAFNWDKIYDN